MVVKKTIISVFSFIFLKISVSSAALPPLGLRQVIRILHHKAASNAGRILMQVLCVPLCVIAKH